MKSRSGRNAYQAIPATNSPPAMKSGRRFMVILLQYRSLAMVSCVWRAGDNKPVGVGKVPGAGYFFPGTARWVKVPVQEKWRRPSRHLTWSERALWDSTLGADQFSEIGDFAENLDCAVASRQLLEELCVVFQPVHTVGQQPAEPAGVLSLGLRHVADPHLEVLAVGVDCADHHLIAEHELQVDLIRRDFDRPIAAGDAGEDEHAILAERLHPFGHNG